MKLIEKNRQFAVRTSFVVLVVLQLVLMIYLLQVINIGANNQTQTILVSSQEALTQL